MIRNFVSISILAIAFFAPGAAFSHSSNQSFVLLLPTGLYIAAGVSAVILTVVIVGILPQELSHRLFASVTVRRCPHLPGRVVTSCLSAVLVLALVALGVLGSPDPTRNPLPVLVWTVFWTGLVLLQGTSFEVWSWLNPWTGPMALARRLGVLPVLKLEYRFGSWAALVCFIGFAVVLLIHPSVSDPGMLAVFVLVYWGIHLAGGLIFGPLWLKRAEALTGVMQSYARLSVLGTSHGKLRLGLPGWKVIGNKAPTVSIAILMITLLAVGSFDGLYQTFFWFSVLGLNPLEFAGRSTIVTQNMIGLAAALPVLVALYGAALWIGLWLAGEAKLFGKAFPAFAPALLPIALAYHFAHYLPGFLVDIQSLPIVLTDPMGTGADLLHLGPQHVTTGFLNRLDTVRVIWLSQAGAVVAGHIIAILMSHAIAQDLLGTPGKARTSQIPMACFMILYTLFGLWLLASPRIG